MNVAVIAHTGKSVGSSGIEELRTALAGLGIEPTSWYEVDKSRKAPAKVAKALDRGADLLFVWGGDGTVQRCVDAAAGHGVPIAILPAGTANALAGSLGIPTVLDEAIAIGLHGPRRQLDVGKINGERFVVMAGTGFDAAMIRDVDSRAKNRIGRAAYVWTGARNLDFKPTAAKVTVDGVVWHDGPATCVLFGNIGQLMGGLDAFPDARPDDGLLEVGIVTAEGPWQWMRVLGRAAVGRGDGSPFVKTTTGRRIDVALHTPWPYELDGGERSAVKRLKVRVEEGAISVCVPIANAATAAVKIEVGGGHAVSAMPSNGGVLVAPSSVTSVSVAAGPTS